LNLKIFVKNLKDSLKEKIFF